MYHISQQTNGRAANFDRSKSDGMVKKTPSSSTERPHKRGDGFDFDKPEAEMPSSSASFGSDKDTPNCDPQFCPNRPHPSLEYPLLYFGLKMWPWLQNNIKSLYAFRWRMSYPLQKKVTFSRTLRKLRIHLTWGELVLLIPFWVAVIAAVLYTFYSPSVSVTGHVARTALIGCFVFAQRNSVVTLLLGMPVDRSLFYHKLSARVALIGTIAHAWAFFIDPKYQAGTTDLTSKLATAYVNRVNTAGTSMSILIIGIIFTALPFFRRHIFEFFYYYHIVLVFGVVVGAYFHTGKLVPMLVALTWGVDIFIRSVVMARCRYPRKANLRILSDTVLELSFPKIKGFDYNPGQYIYIALPELSWLQWHPFSLSSSPKMKTVTLHIRRAGNWTNSLYELAKTKSEVSILMEGPYGSLAVDAYSHRYSCLLLVSGGIGITPMQSICDQLCYEQTRKKRNLKKIKFIWTDRDPVMMNEAPVVRRSSTLTVAPERDAEFNDDVSSYEQAAGDVNESPFADIFSQLIAAVPPGVTSDEQLEHLYESLDLIMDLDAEHLDYQGGLPPVDEDDREGELGEFDDREDPLASINESHHEEGEDTTVADNSDPWHIEEANRLVDILDMQLYYTGRGPMGTTNLPNMKRGRPDFKSIFLDMKQEAMAKGERRVAVCVCAPQKISDICRKACIVYSDSKVRFDFHTESMEG